LLTFTREYPVATTPALIVFGAHWLAHIIRTISVKPLARLCPKLLKILHFPTLNLFIFFLSDANAIDSR
jgi:hypothetical protein